MCELIASGAEIRWVLSRWSATRILVSILLSESFGNERKTIGARSRNDESLGEFSTKDTATFAKIRIDRQSGSRVREFIASALASSLGYRR